jgi:acyl-CoA dehydrogenase
MSQIDEFRAETRAWLEENCPPGARGPGQTPYGSKKIELAPDVRLWLERMAERGWTVPTWPKMYGGAELERDEYTILIAELKRLNARTPLTGRGVNYIGPTILELGSEAQKNAGSPVSRAAKVAGRWVIRNQVPGRISQASAPELFSMAINTC